MLNETELCMAMTACATGFCRLHRVEPPPDRTFDSLAKEAFLHQVMGVFLVSIFVHFSPTFGFYFEGQQSLLPTRPCEELDWGSCSVSDELWGLASAQNDAKATLGGECGLSGVGPSPSPLQPCSHSTSRLSLSHALYINLLLCKGCCSRSFGSSKDEGEAGRNGHRLFSRYSGECFDFYE